jgi:hypothetical protein
LRNFDIFEKLRIAMGISLSATFFWDIWYVVGIVGAKFVVW